MSRRVVRCASCDRFRPVHAHGRCDGCYTRWWNAGCPDQWPPPPGTTQADNAAIARAARDANYAARLEDYAELRHEYREIPEVAARRLGISQSTAERYEQLLRRQAVS